MNLRKPKTFPAGLAACFAGLAHLTAAATAVDASVPLSGPGRQAVAPAPRVEKPLWELGLGVGGLYLPDYRGSDQSQGYLAPLPVLVYRGTWFKSDREGTRAMLAGIMAFHVTAAPDEYRNLAAVRRVLLLPDEELNIEAHEMMGSPECGGLAKAAGQMIVTALQSAKGIEKDCLQKARAATAWRYP